VEAFEDKTDLYLILDLCTYDGWLKDRAGVAKIHVVD
jgi:hypothetical protein